MQVFFICNQSPNELTGSISSYEEFTKQDRLSRHSHLIRTSSTFARCLALTKSLTSHQPRSSSWVPQITAAARPLRMAQIVRSRPYAQWLALGTSLRNHDGQTNADDRANRVSAVEPRGVVLTNPNDSKRPTITVTKPMSRFLL